MKEFCLGGVTATILLDTRRAKKKSLYPVKYRVTYKRKQDYLKSGINLTEEDWKHLSDTKKQKLIDVRNQLNTGFDFVEKAINDLFKSGKEFSFNLLKTQLKVGKIKTLKEYFDYRIEDLKKNGNIGNADMYQCTLNSLLDYAGNSSIKLTDIDVDFLRDYENCMLKNKRSYTTISMYTRTLRAVINSTRTNNEINTINYPFGKNKYEIPRVNGIKKALEKEQIKEVVKFPIKSGTKAEMYKDLWFFSYLCNGMNVYDICKLKYSNIIDDEIIFFRQKTYRTTNNKKPIVVAILPEIYEIIEKWGTENKLSDNYIFPFFKKGLTPEQEKAKVKIVTKSINKCLKNISKHTNIGKITTYTARHSFATILSKNGANMLSIRDSMGHADSRTTENYIASTQKDERKQNAKLLTNF